VGEFFHFTPVFKNPSAQVKPTANSAAHPRHTLPAGNLVDHGSLPNLAKNRKRCAQFEELIQKSGNLILDFQGFENFIELELE
jgi:hypothetical protein